GVLERGGALYARDGPGGRGAAVQRAPLLDPRHRYLHRGSAAGGAWRLLRGGAGARAWRVAPALRDAIPQSGAAAGADRSRTAQPGALPPAQPDGFALSRQPRRRRNLLPQHPHLLYPANAAQRARAPMRPSSARRLSLPWPF